MLPSESCTMTSLAGSLLGSSSPRGQTRNKSVSTLSADCVRRLTFGAKCCYCHDCLPCFYRLLNDADCSRRLSAQDLWTSDSSRRPQTCFLHADSRPTAVARWGKHAPRSVKGVLCTVQDSTAFARPHAPSETQTRTAFEQLKAVLLRPRLV
ncbi:hypothetical protein IWX90DRAFT_195292 [Phyllosticta citrichinensis]|uniref:Uncharacterized protein n=1 Tax=Phyllosticta citrichinensis TaxID=1130410 RepID=A0ABR1XXP4_9PEZI